MPAIQDKPLGLAGRMKSAMSVMRTGKLPNPLASPPRDQSRAALVTELNEWCIAERKFWKPVFDRIRQEQKFAAGKQWEGQDLSTEEPDDYIGDMVQQMVNRKTANLYAKNPEPEAVLRERLNFEVWDGRHETIENCKALLAQVGPQAMAAREAELQGQPVPPAPELMQQDVQKASAIMADYARGMREKLLLERIAETGEKLVKQQWESQSPDFLISGKKAVTRIITSRVAFIKVMYKRDMELRPTQTANNMELAEKVSALTSRIQALEQEEAMQDDPRREEIRLMQASLQREQAALEAGEQSPVSEGIVLDWLPTTSVLVDRRCTNLCEFVGAHRVAQEILMTVQDCEQFYQVSLRDSGAKIYSVTGNGYVSDERDGSDDQGEAAQRFANRKVCVWVIEDKDTGEVYHVCDGVKDFLKEPEENGPPVNRFWSIVATTFNAQEVEINDPECDATIYPRSDVRLMMPMQINVNRAGQEKREHRAANRPFWIGVKSKFASTGGKNDLLKLKGARNAHDVLMLENLQPGEKISDYIQPGPKQEFDQNLYDNGQDSQAMMLATGQQPSDVGAQRPNEKATGQNIAAQARAESEQSNIDDLNLTFSTVAQMCWEMLVQEMPAATVKQLVGRGAVFPEINREQVAKSIFFSIKAGSMGRPNQMADIQKFRELMPQILEMFKLLGRSPEPLLKLALRLWDANIDLDALLAESPVQAPPAAQPEPQRPPSLALSMNFKDLPPEVQQQAEQLFGFTPANPASHLIQKVGHAQAVAAHHQNNQPAQPAPQTEAQKLTTPKT